MIGDTLSVADHICYVSVVSSCRRSDQNFCHAVDSVIGLTPSRVLDPFFAPAVGMQRG